MATRSEMFPSRFLRAADLQGKPITVTIETANKETLKNEGGEKCKTVLTFRGKQKCLALNLTNWISVEDITGEADTRNWPDHRIELYPAQVEMRGEIVDCIRIRAPAQGELKPTQKQKPTASTKPPPDMDDEIPW